MEWLVFLVLGPPAAILLESASEKLFSKERGYSISEKAFSLKRICFGLITALILFSVLFLFSLVTKSAYSP